MGTELRELLLQQKEWRREKAELMAANEEFVVEVERLYGVEDRWKEEREAAAIEAEAERKGLEQELGQLGREVAKERGRWEEEVGELRERLAAREGEGGTSLLEQELQRAREHVEEERVKRTEADEVVRRLSQELEGEEKDLLEVKAAFVELSKKYTELEDASKKMSKEHTNNLENIDNIEELKLKLKTLLEKGEKAKKDIEKLKNDKKLLQQSVKSAKEQEENKRQESEEIESIKEELKSEREKVTIIT